MLCPVCKRNPLTGLKPTAKACSDKCRSALYRERKRQRSKTSQHQEEQAAKDPPATAGSAPRRSRLRNADVARFERIVSAAADRILEAIAKHGLPATSPGAALARTDMREQLIAQVPAHAVGYRVVLPPRRTGDAPKHSLPRSRAREVAWYSLAPFEYPDDTRLCDGCWYRIVWVDAQGQRIRLRPGEPVPGLHYFVGLRTKVAALASQRSAAEWVGSGRAARTCCGTSRDADT